MSKTAILFPAPWRYLDIQVEHVSLKDRTRKWMRAVLLLGTSQYRAKVGLTFFTAQDWTYMGGYIQKDQGKPHYRFFAYPGFRPRLANPTHA